MALVRSCTIALAVQLGLLAWIAGLGGIGCAAGAALGLVLGGVGARAALRRAPGATAMLALGGLGMTFGWWADLELRTAAAVAAHARAPLDLVWCRSPAGPASLAGLPGLDHVVSWMNAGMLAAGMPAARWARRGGGCAPRRGARAAIGCAVAMTLGMTAGSIAAAAIAAPLAPTQGVLADWALMSGGMLLGMALAERAPRWLAQIPRHAAIATSAQPRAVTRKPAAPA